MKTLARPGRQRFGRILRSDTTRGLLIVLIAAWIVRAAVIVFWPASAHSTDVVSWEVVAQQLRLGLNPYATTTFLNWPPVWMVLIYVIDHARADLGISFFLGLRLFLIAVESVLIVVAHRLLARLSSTRRATHIILVGLSLNPIAVLLICQHGNFDVLAGLFVVTGVLALTSAETEVNWIAGAAAFGAAALVKTVPLVVAPLLAPEARRASPVGRALAILALLGPIALGVAVIYVLAPSAVSTNVLGYRSGAGFFGITGLLDVAGAHGVTHAYQRAFPFLAVLALLIFARYAPREPRRIVLAAAVALAAVPTFGPGWAPQYAYWFLPLLVVSFPLFDVLWRRLLLVCYAVAALTYVEEYALVPSQGQFLRTWITSAHPLGVSWIPSVHSLGLTLSTPRAQTLTRLPLFIVLAVVVIAGGRLAFAERPGRLTTRPWRLRSSGPER